LPELVFVVDVRREETAIHEANLLNIPVIAMVDTNCDPRDVDYVIPSNDDAIRAIKLLVGKIADAAIEGKAMRKEDEVEEGGAIPTRAVMTGAEEPELSDEELLGESTLAKISFKVPIPEIEDEEVVWVGDAEAEDEEVVEEESEYTSDDDENETGEVEDIDEEKE
jgi:small subunit ribosomal protein S2